MQKKREQYGDIIPYLYDFHLTVVNDRRLTWNKYKAKKCLPEFQKTYAMLNGETSKKTIELYLRVAVNGEFDELYKICHEDTAYINDITRSADIETLIDCGAFDRDLIHDFISVFSNYSNIYAIDPNSLNREKLADRVQTEKVQNIIIVPKGVYKESTALHFSCIGNSASHMDESGEISVPIIA